jgi:hypothetical protein
MVFLTWFQDNWFTLLQSVGIIGALFFTGISLRIDAKVRRVTNRFEATKQHREIWTLLYSRDDLKRVMDEKADLQARPVTAEEKLFVNFLILHLESNYRAAKAGMFALPAELKTDISAFFSRPIPRAVWQAVKPLKETDFVQFVEQNK